jgi:hypothetical protein
MFWHFKAELHNIYECERYAVIMEEYLFHCGPHAADLRKQYEVVQKLQRISGRVATRKQAKDVPDDEIQVRPMRVDSAIRCDMCAYAGRIR